MTEPLSNKYLHFLLVGNAPYLNKGCEAIVRGTMVILRKQFGESFRVTVASFGTPDIIEKQAEEEYDPLIKHVCLPNLKWPRQPFGSCRWFSNIIMRAYGKTLRTLNGKSVITHVRMDAHMDLSLLDEPIRSASLALQIGGDNYSLEYGPPIRFMKLDEYLFANQIPVVLWGASVGPFTKAPFFAPKIHNHLKKLSLILIREDASREYLKKHQIIENVLRMNDPAFVMVPEPVAYQELGVPLAHDMIGINLSPLMAKFATNGDMAKWRDQSVAIIDRVCQEFCLPVLLVPHVTMPNSDDHSFLRGIMQKFTDRSGPKVYCLNHNLSAAQTKWVIGQCAVFAGARTHATIAAMSLGLPTLSFSYSLKAKGLNKEVFGTQDYCIAPTDLTPKTVVHRIKLLFERSETIRDHLKRRLPQLTEGCYQAGKVLAELVARKQGIQQTRTN